MQNWARCANQRKKQPVLKGNCCIETESKIKRLFTSWYSQPVNTNLGLAFFFFTEGK